MISYIITQHLIILSRMKKKIRIRRPLYQKFLRVIDRIIIRSKGFRIKDKYKVEKGEKFVILCNHVTDYDPMVLALTVKPYFYVLSTDNIYSTRFTRFWLPRLGGVPKRKGKADVNSLKQMLYIASKGGSLVIFPEGNRSYGDFQYYIAPNFSSLMYKLKSTIIIYNIVGGFGSYPRFSKKRRKGPLYTKLRRVLKYDEYKDMDPKELNDIIVNNLKCFDIDTKNLYKSPAKAEYLERELFVCPKCGNISTLHSHKDHLTCEKCGLNVTYNEDLTLSSDDKDFKFTRLSQWYLYQKDFVKNMNIGDEIIFSDENVKMQTANPFEIRKKLAKGKMELTKDTLSVGNYKIDVKDIEIASPVSGRKLVLTVNGNNLQIKGTERFNALKYVLMFNRLDTRMKLEKVDDYFTL